MSFRDSSGRYGHVPPAQYRVPGQPQDLARRLSFTSGDEATFFDASSAGNKPGYARDSERATEELFLTSSAESHSHQHRQSYSGSSPALAGYQHQFQGHTAPPTAAQPSAYNPQNFARSPTTSLPYHPHPASRYSSPTSPTYAPAPASALAQGSAPTPAPAPSSPYSPVQAYNPAAYANASVPQRNPSAASYSSYGGYGYNSPAVPQSSTFGQLPARTPGSSHSGHAQSPPAQVGYDSTAPSPQYPPSSGGASAASPSLEQPYFPDYSAQTRHTSYTPNSAHPAPTAQPYSHASSQMPYPAYSQIPVGPNYSPQDPHSFLGGGHSRSNSVDSFSAPAPFPAQSSPGLQRHPTNAPLPRRPMEDLAEEPAWFANGRPTDGDVSQEHMTQESLIEDIVLDLGGVVPADANGPGEVYETGEPLYRYDSAATTINPSGEAAGVGRFTSNASTLYSNRQQTPNDWKEEGEEGDEEGDDESDPEAVAGLLAMQEADLQDQTFTTLPTFSYVDPQQASAPPTQAEAQESTDSDYGGMDLGFYGGGYAGNLHYGNELSPAPTAGNMRNDEGRSLPAPHRGSESYPPFSEASVDYGGTGGFAAPQLHRLSFDEEDEHVSVHSRPSGSESPLRDDYPDMFYHPGLSSRPLPALPAGTDARTMLSAQPQSQPPHQHGYSLSIESRVSRDTGEVYQGENSALLHVERSISLTSHSNTPQVQTPARSRTDAAEERRKALKQNQQQYYVPPNQALQYEGYDSTTPSSLSAYDMPLPAGRKRKFNPSKLTTREIRSCTEPWALSSITAWVRENAEGDPEVKRKTIEEGLVKLFCAKVPTMNVADAEVLSSTVVDSMFAAGILLPEEEWVKFGPGSMSGVLWQLTGSGCYAPKLHEDESQVPRLHGTDIPVRCYSHHCGRTLKKANLDVSEEEVKAVSWVEFYGVSLEEMGRKGKKEVERQNVLHEIVTGEEEYMNQLDVLRVLYKDQLRAYQPPVLPANKVDKFIKAVFGQVEAVQRVNKEHLLAQLKYRQKEQGPWIGGFSDLFREWIRKARPAYLEYSLAFPNASHLIRKEADRNLVFRQFLDIVRNDRRSKRLEWTTFLKAPITRLQRYGLLLETVRKNMIGDSEEKTNLTKALEEIKTVTHECDEKVDEMTKKIALIELQNMLVLRQGSEAVLNLDHLGRELIKQGELQRQGSKGVRWVDTHALLFDHYFILAKAVRGGKNYDVSKEPIPMPLLFLEGINDDPVSKQKGITAPLARTTVAAGSGTQLNKVTSNGSDRPGLDHITSSSSMASLSAVTRLATPGTADPEGKIIYPFRVKHLGNQVYTLYASSQQDRDAWCSAIIEAKTRHGQALHAQNAEPFRLRVLSDSAFAYDSVTAIGKQPAVVIRGTPLDRALREMRQTYGAGRPPAPVCHAQVNCAAAFSANGRSIIAIGTDYGIYISEASNPRGWTRSVLANRVTQIAVLEEFSVCLAIADKSLISYPLDVVAPANYPAAAHDNPKKAPQRLAKDVTFFATARMKERMLLFYKRKEGMHNTFKVLEPVFLKATEKRPRIFGRRGGAGSTESFRDFDEFYLPTECFSLNIFQTYIAIASAKGFELLTLDKKIPQSIPRDLGTAELGRISSRIRDQRPLGMFRLNDQEFLLAYEDCAVYVDKHGEVSRTLVMQYSGRQRRARSATMFGQYLLLFTDDYVEVRNAENGRLRQIIAGRDVRCLDYGFRGPGAGSGAGQMPSGQDSKGTVKICMSHPEIAGGQIVLEMLLNDGHREEQAQGP